MMKRLITILFVSVAFLGCEPNLKPEKPENLISREKMVDVLHDMFIVSSAKGISRIKLEKNGLNPELYILKKYDIDNLQFAKSNDYYAYDVEAYKAIIDKIKERLNTEKEKFVAIDKEEQEERTRIKDSLKKAKQVQKANPNLDALKISD